MNSKIVIIILSSIIVIQMIAGVLILKRGPMPGPPIPQFGFMDEGMGMRMGMGKQHMRGNRFGRAFCEPGFMKDTLSLNQNQIDRIAELNKKFDKEFTGYTALIDPEREKLKNMLESKTYDMNSIKEQLKKIEAYNLEIHMLRIKQGKEISEILTPEQMNILHSERDRFFEKMKKRPGGPQDD